MKFHNYIVTVAVLAMTVTFFALGVQKAYSKSTEDFALQAAQGNEFEIEAAQIAIDKSPSSRVVNFSRKIVMDHTAAASRLQTLLIDEKKNGVTQNLKLDSDQIEKLGKLKSEDGDHFDDQYIIIQQEAHTGAIALFQDYVSTGTDPAMKDFAQSTLPTLQMHLQMVNDIAQRR